MKNSNDLNLKKIRGDFGEVTVRDYLIKRGYRVIASNYRKRVGEIDIIAVFDIDKEVIFIEVKTRKQGGLIEGVESVNHTKRQKIFKTARAFIAENPQFCRMNTRFDVAEVTITGGESPQLLKIDYYEDAFNPIFL